MTIVSDIVKDIISIRGYKKVSEEKKEWGIEVLVKDKNGEDILIWGLEKVKIIGVKWIRDMVAELKKRNIPSGVVIGGSRSTKSALTLAKENNIGVITRELPLAPLLHHELVPKHSIATEEEVNEVLTKYGIRKQQLPWIKASDPVARAIGAKPGDVVKIIRSSPVAGVSVYYRYVVES